MEPPKMTPITTLRKLGDYWEVHFFGSFRGSAFGSLGNPKPQTLNPKSRHGPEPQTKLRLRGFGHVLRAPGMDPTLAVGLWVYGSIGLGLGFRYIGLRVEDPFPFCRVSGSSDVGFRVWGLPRGVLVFEAYRF